ncbi:MAG: hypothetical protein PHT53_04770 [Candidatus Omnitrophica bacterium]|nr:hypothetical protein [Candidatus Omnitrophota bacterium]
MRPPPGLPAYKNNEYALLCPVIIRLAFIFIVGKINEADTAIL